MNLLQPNTLCSERSTELTKNCQSLGIEKQNVNQTNLNLMEVEEDYKTFKPQQSVNVSKLLRVMGRLRGKRNTNYDNL